MSIIYNPYDVFVVQRSADSSSFIEKVLSSKPNSVFFFDSASNVVAIPTSSIGGGTSISSSISVSSSYAYTASFAVKSDWSDSASYLNPGANIYLSQSYIFADTNSMAPSQMPGQIWWDVENHTYVIDTLQSRLQIGQENWIRVLAGEYLPNGSVVYINGTDVDPHNPGARLPIVWAALADGTGLSSSVVGIITQNSSMGEEGFVTTHGVVNDLDTQTPDFNPGDTVYLSSTQTGSLQNFIPNDPFEKIVIGNVLYRNFSTGRILVNISILPLFTIPSASVAISSSYAVSASYALDTPTAVSSSHAIYAKTASFLIPGNPLHLSNSYIQASPSASAPSWKEGRLFWDKVNHTYALYNDVNGATLQLGQENYIHVIAGENIADASAVYIDGPQQDPDNPTNWMPKIYKALADTSTTTGIDRVAGLTTHAFTSGSAGWITTTGIIHDVDTSTFTPGIILYLSPTIPGGYQEVEPGQPYSSVEIGTVIQSDANGSILVNPRINPAPSNAYAGMTTVPYIDGTLNDGTVIVSTGSVNLYADSSGIGAVTSYNIPETILTLVSGSTNYITTRISSSLVEGEYFLTTDATYANGINIVRVAQLDIYTAEGTQWDVHQFDVGIVGLALANRINNKDIKLYGFQRQDGLTLYVTGSNGSFGITEGNIWYGPNSHIVPVFDTTLPDYYTYIFYTSGSGWHQHTSSIYLNGVYDSGAGSSSLTVCGPLSWSVNFVYRIIGTTDECAIIMSNAQYDTELEASNNATTPPNLPSTIKDQCLLIGRFVVQSGSYSTVVIESAFSNIFIPAVVTDHESLLGLQGSTIGDGSGHYHLKSDDYAGTGTGVVVRNNKPSFVGATVGHIPYWNANQQLTLTGSVQVYDNQYVLINSGSADPVFPEALLVKQVNTSSALGIGSYGTVDNFFQIYNQNFSSGSEASTDICATADIGNQDVNFIDMGVAGSGFASVFWPWEKPLDGYLMMHGGDLWLATLTDNKLLFVFNNTASTNYADKTGFYLSGSLKGTSSWANNAISASWAPDQTVTVISASWASASISASYVSNLYPQTYQESASWASASVSASYAISTSYAISASYVPNLYSQTTVPSASWVSASAFITTAQTASFVSAANVVGTVTSASFAISASWAPDQTVTVISASWASSSLSSSYASGIPTIKSGIVAGATFSTTNPRTASIVFAKPFLDNNYSVTVTGESSRTWTIQSKVSGSFVINSNNGGAIANNTFWHAIATGEYYS